MIYIFCRPGGWPKLDSASLHIICIIHAVGSLGTHICAASFEDNRTKIAPHDQEKSFLNGDRGAYIMCILYNNIVVIIVVRNVRKKRNSYCCWRRYIMAACKI